MRKIIFALPVSYTLIACSPQALEELVFRKTVAYSMNDHCGENEACKEAIKTQLKPCMEKNNWRKFLDSPDDELTRFTRGLYSCIVDKEGNSYFYSTYDVDETSID